VHPACATSALGDSQRPSSSSRFSSSTANSASLGTSDLTLAIESAQQNHPQCTSNDPASAGPAAVLRSGLRRANISFSGESPPLGLHLFLTRFAVK